MLTRNNKTSSVMHSFTYSLRWLVCGTAFPWRRRRPWWCTERTRQTVSSSPRSRRSRPHIEVRSSQTCHIIRHHRLIKHLPVGVTWWKNKGWSASWVANVKSASNSLTFSDTGYKLHLIAVQINCNAMKTSRNTEPEVTMWIICH